jgi:hypothetical protein
VQNPEVHWFDAVQAWPTTVLGTHVPVASQWSAAMQSESERQLVLQALPPHR